MPRQGLSGDSGFLAANLYARSIFGEDALANLSVEKPFNKPDAPVIGHIRIRAKSQVSNERGEGGGGGARVFLLWFLRCH